MRFLFHGILALMAISASAQSPSPAQLVRDAAANEVRTNADPADLWMYRLSKETKSGSQVKDMVETKDGIVARLIAVNGRSLTPTERAADDQRHTDLATNLDEQKRKKADQQKEQDRFINLVKA